MPGASVCGTPYSNVMLVLNEMAFMPWASLDGARHAYASVLKSI